ncbi:MAG TPA: SIS domain-containing protein [Terriglobales bacterium]|nr:SIS domain-containing protein [Terriglobales bacterium]
MTNYTLNEICSQPEVWQQTLDLCQQHDARNFREWLSSSHPVLTGSGSSFYLCLTAAAYFTKLTGHCASAISASEVCTFAEAYFSARSHGSLLAVSRKGKSVETVEAARWFKEKRSAQTITISTLTESPLLELCEPALLLTVAAEQSRYMTRSFTSMLLAIQWLAAAATEHQELTKELFHLPEIGRQVLDRCRTECKFLAEQKPVGDFVGLGQGPFYGLSAESMLKLKEMVRVPAQAYPSLEVMHGPNYLFNKDSLITLILSDSARSYELALLEKLRKSEASVFVICESASPEIRAHANYVFELKSRLSELARLILVMPIMQFLAYYRALVTGKILE